jgi:hypothetical protein
VTCVVQSVAEDRAWTGLLGGAVIALTYLVPAAGRRIELHAEAEADQFVLSIGLGPVLAGLLRRYKHPMTLERMQRLERPVEQPQRPRHHLGARLRLCSAGVAAAGTRRPGTGRLLRRRGQQFVQQVRSSHRGGGVWPVTFRTDETIVRECMGCEGLGGTWQRSRSGAFKRLAGSLACVAAHVIPLRA